MGQAACRDKDPEMFFPPRGQASLANEAKMVCLGCGVRAQCDEFRDRSSSTHGVWAGRLITRQDEIDNDS